ncbi:MAG: GTPase Era [Clostridiales bacterium]|nr:GTPase Era [Clostridiales bacterium]
MNNYKSGFAAIIGRPNVGKSTLLNALAGVKIAIVSNKPQTTRGKIQAVVTTEGFQAVFLDTPGLHSVRSKLDDYMKKSVDAALDGADVILYLAEPTVKLVRENAEYLARLRGAPVILLINKADKLKEEGVIQIIAAYREVYDFAHILPISALTGQNLDVLRGLIEKFLPEGPKYFDDDYLTDSPERTLACEIIREKALLLLQDEVPHGVAVEITSMKERDGRKMMDVEAVIYCEKRSHKGIIIGKNGETLKKIASSARVDIENLLDTRVNLQTWVKVKEGWRNDATELRRIGYNAKNIN